MTHFEETLQRAIDLVRSKVMEMAALAERSLNDCVRALRERNRQLSYSIILRDQRIDELEKEIDRLCLEFIIRQQPVAGHLRFVYATIKINAELERIGDYAESIARQILKISSMKTEVPVDRLVEIAELSIPMLRDAIQAFVTQNPELASITIATEEKVDSLRNAINAELVQLRQENRIPLEALTPLMTIARRFERVSDQAKSICEEVLYMCTGEFAKHKGAEVYRILFLDEHNSCLSQMAEALGNSLAQPRFVFSSAGVDPKPMDPHLAGFLREKEIDISRQGSKTIEQIPHIDHYQIVISLSRNAHRVLPSTLHKALTLEWTVDEPSRVSGKPEEVRAAYEHAYQYLHGQIQDLVEAILGDKIE